jgi:sulfite exporter TauE/SafE
VTEIILSAFLLGVLGVGHCLGMCGGFAAALAYAIPSKRVGRRFFLLLAYNFGRIGSYALLGGFVAASQNQLWDSGLPIMRSLAGLLLVAVGLYLAEIWNGITLFERGGRKLWRYIQPMAQKLIPVYTIPKALLLGALWGWLPCGLVYAVLALAATTPHMGYGALTMAAFGVGTLPAVLAGGLAASWVRQWMAKSWLRKGLAACFIVFGIWTIAIAWYHNSHHHSGPNPEHAQHPPHH